MLSKNKLSLAVMLGSLTLSSFSFSETRSISAELLTVGPKGKIITFNDRDTSVKSKVSGSRTKVTINGESADRKNLQVGMLCEMEYNVGGKNEPVFLSCK